MKKSTFMRIGILAVILFAAYSFSAQVSLNQELCEITKKYVKSQKMEFLCTFTLTNNSNSDINLSDEDDVNFQKPCECTTIQLTSAKAKTTGGHKSMKLAKGESATFEVLYILDGAAKNDREKNLYNEHIAEFKESGGIRSQTIILTIKETNQSFNLEFIYNLEGIK